MFAFVITLAVFNVTNIIGWAIPAYILVLCSMWGTVRRRVHPSIYGLVPLSPRRRVAYEFIFLAVMSVLVLVYLIVLLLSYALIGMLVQLSMYGNIADSFSNSYFIYQLSGLKATHPYGIFYCIILAVASFGIGNVYSYINGKFAHISVICYIVAILIINILITVGAVLFKEEAKWGVVSNIHNLPLAPLWLSLMALVALALVGWSVYLGLKRSREYDF